MYDNKKWPRKPSKLTTTAFFNMHQEVNYALGASKINLLLILLEQVLSKFSVHKETRVSAQKIALKKKWIISRNNKKGVLIAKGKTNYLVILTNPVCVLPADVQYRKIKPLSGSDIM